MGRDPKKIAKLNEGNTLFYEPGLEELLKHDLKSGRLTFTVDYEEVIPQADIIFICVGTPSSETGQADLTQVLAVAERIGKNLKNNAVVVCKSTVPVGTNRLVADIINKVKKDKTHFMSASCPEFLREGTALHDTLHPDRIVIGADLQDAVKILMELHKPIDGKFVLTSIETAEMIKYTANSFLATKISFANSIALLCEKVGADVEKVMDGIGLDRRIGRLFLYPGVGYGGSCFPKDVKALIAISENAGYDFKLLKEVENINKEIVLNFVTKIKKHYGALHGKKLAILGLAFKPNTDDMREAPSIKIINFLQKEGALIYAYDPVARETASKVLRDVIFCDDVNACVEGKDGAVFITEWNEFKQLNLKDLKKQLKNPVIFDGRNIYDPVKIRKIGFKYYSVGRK